MNKDELEELFTRGVASFIDPDGAFREKVTKKAGGEYPGDIVIKLGVDPTRPDIHLGHAAVLRRLRQFQEVGCKVVFLVGDFTARIGDPSGNSKVRPEITAKEIEVNMKTFVDQVGKILLTDEKSFSWITNSDWFLNVTDISAGPSTKIEIDGKKVDPNSFMGKALIYENTRMQKTALKQKAIQGVSLTRFLSVLRSITHSRLIARDMFQERIKKEEELYMHEMMYPVLQGIDSAVLAQIYGSCDLEIGGTDQTFNMLVGRDVMKMSGLPEQAVMAMDILAGTDGKEKMSKSLDNYIAITDTPSDMFGKVMSVPDSVISEYFRLATYTPVSEIEKMEKDLASGKLHPRDAKLRLAGEITAIYHGDKEAKKAEKEFVEVFSKGGVPKDVKTVKAAKDEALVDILLREEMVSSKTEFNRLNKEGAIKEMEPGVYRIGKHRFIKIERE